MRCTKMHTTKESNFLLWWMEFWLVNGYGFSLQGNLHNERTAQAWGCVFEKKIQFFWGMILTDSFPIFFCSRVCHWTACITMASHLLSRFTMISCMGWWSAFRLQVSRSSRRCWHSRRMEATPLRRCLISWQRDCDTEKDQFACVCKTDFWKHEIITSTIISQCRDVLSFKN